MDWANLVLLVQNPLWITNNKQNIVNLHQDFMDRVHSDFFQGQTIRGPFYWPKHTAETGLSKARRRDG